MDRQSLFFKGPEDPPTFSQDDYMPDFPLPDLDATLDRYYQSLLPFGTEEELRNSREIIRRFKEGVGPKLHQRIVDRTKVTKNWVSTKCWSFGEIPKIKWIPITVLDLDIWTQCCFRTIKFTLVRFLSYEKLTCVVDVWPGLCQCDKWLCKLNRNGRIQTTTIQFALDICIRLEVSSRCQGSYLGNWLILNKQTFNFKFTLPK